MRQRVEDRLKEYKPLYSYTEGPELGHGRIETRTYNIYDGLEIIADKEKWGVNMTIIEYMAKTVRKTTKINTRETRLYVSSLPADTPSLGSIVRHHWSIESMHWGLDVNLLQDKVKRKSAKAATLIQYKEWSTLYFLYGKGCAKRDLTREKAWQNLYVMSQ